MTARNTVARVRAWAVLAWLVMCLLTPRAWVGHAACRAASPAEVRVTAVARRFLGSMTRRA